MSILTNDRHSRNRRSVRRQPSARTATWRMRAAAVAVASCFAGGAYSNPTGPAVVSGTATIQSQGNLLSITNSPNAIINWQSFSIGANEITRFIQQSASSAVLNRVVGQDPSAILGALQSNGRVFLINPNGIAFGPNAMIDVAGLVASTLNMADADFLAGRLKFQQTLGAGGINNQGSIVTPAGGQVYLIAPNIENSGLIRSPQGEIILAAGQSVELVDVGTPNLRVQITAPDNQAVNLGQIVADSGRVGVYAGLISNSGTVSADTVVVGEKGQIIFRASQNIALEDGSKVSASGAPGGVHDGGEVRLIAENTLDMKQGSQVRVDGGADGGHGGFLELSGKQQIALNGQYTGRAQQPGFRGGSLLIDPENIIICDPGACGDGIEPGSLGGSGSIAAGDSPGETLYLETNMTEGGWTNVSLEANNEIQLLSLLENSDIPNGGSLTLRTLAGDILLNNDIGTFQARFQHELILAAGQDIQFNASIYQGTPDISATAGRDVQVNGYVDLGGGNLSATAGRDVVVGGNNGAYVVSDTTSNVTLSGANVKVLAGEFSSSNISTQGDVILNGTQSVLVQGGGCGEGCAEAYVYGNNVTLQGGAVTLAGGAAANGGGEASVSANDLVAVTGTSLTLSGGVSGESYGYANASVNGSRVAVDVSGGVTVQGGNAVGSQGFGGSASASLRGYESVAINAGGAVNVLGGTASGTGYYDARAEISGDSVTINGASLLVQGGTAQADGGYYGGNADASARIAATNANLTFTGAALIRGGTATGNDGYAYAEGELVSGSYRYDQVAARLVTEQALAIDGPIEGSGSLTLKADSVLLQGGQANATASVEWSAYADAYGAISDYASVDIQSAKGVGMAAGIANAQGEEYSYAEADASAGVFAGQVSILAGGTIQGVAGTANTSATGEFSEVSAAADAGVMAGAGSIVTDSAGIKLQGGNVTGEGSAVAVMVAMADVNATIRGAGTVDLVPGNDSLGAYAAVVAAPSTIYLDFPGRFAGGFTPAGITNGTTGFFTFVEPGDLSNLTPAVLGETMIVSYGLLPPVFPPPGEGGLELPNNIFVDETNNATNFNVGGNNLPLLEDEDDGKPKQVCS